MRDLSRTRRSAPLTGIRAPTCPSRLRTPLAAPPQPRPGPLRLRRALGFSLSATSVAGRPSRRSRPNRPRHTAISDPPGPRSSVPNPRPLPARLPNGGTPGASPGSRSEGRQGLLLRWPPGARPASRRRRRDRRAPDPPPRPYSASRPQAPSHRDGRRAGEGDVNERPEQHGTVTPGASRAGPAATTGERRGGLRSGRGRGSCAVASRPRKRDLRLRRHTPRCRSGLLPDPRVLPAPLAQARPRAEAAVGEPVARP